MSREFVFVQKASVKGQEILNEHIAECAYIEVDDMDGAKLILTLFDHASMYRDDFGIKKGSVIDMTFSDPDGRGDDIWIDSFVVAKASSGGGALTIQCFQKDCHDLKQLESEPIFFVNKQPRDILKTLLPTLKVEADSFPKASTYHLNAGGNRSRLLRSMARDYGALCFICRGTVFFKRIDKLPSSPVFKLEQGNPSAESSIARYTILGEESLFERVIDRNYICWDTVDGLKRSDKNKNKATTLISPPSLFALDNQNRAIIPVLHSELAGNGKFTPAVPVSVVFHKYAPTQEQDESIPQQQWIKQVTHYQKGNRYLCSLITGVRHE